MDERVEEFKPPYMSFQTFWSFIGDLATRPLPPRIDRSMMGSKSGSDQANLTSALVGFRLTDGAGFVQDRLRDLATAEPDARKQILAEIVNEHYGKAVAISAANDTEAALATVFKDEYGMAAPDTRRKAITFFLHALRTANLPVSAYFKQTRPGSGAPGVPKARRASPNRRRGASEVKPAANVNLTPDAQPPAPDPYSHTVHLEGLAGTVTLSVDVNPIRLKGGAREFFYSLVDMLDAYEGQMAGSGTQPGASDKPEGGGS